VCACVGDCDLSAEVALDEILAIVNEALGNTAESACSLADANSDGQIDIAELLLAVNNALYGCQMPLPTPTPTPCAPCPPHGHTCCECAEQAGACMDFAWVEVEPTCSAGCTTFTDAECEAPCHGGPQSGPATCVSLTPCTTDADCDDGNGCTADQCTIDGCTHACVCD
jgi:hypothetical protein